MSCTPACSSAQLEIIATSAVAARMHIMCTRVLYRATIRRFSRSRSMERDATRGRPNEVVMKVSNHPGSMIVTHAASRAQRTRRQR
jgi:hypothetical protein